MAISKSLKPEVCILFPIVNEYVTVELTNVVTDDALIAYVWYRHIAIQIRLRWIEFKYSAFKFVNDHEIRPTARRVRWSPKLTEADEKAGDKDEI